MTKSTPNNFDYDKNNDILYYTFSNNNNSYGDENIDNIVFMRDMDTDDLTGITVLNFIDMYRRHDKRIDIVSQYFDVSDVLKDIT